MAIFEDGFVIFEIRQAANGLERGWYYRMTSSLYNEAVGPFPTQNEAAEVARYVRGEG
jgi:hypothetical protein